MKNNFQYFGFSRTQVFYLIRFSFGIIGSIGIYFFCLAVKKKFGAMVGVLTFILIIFNHNVLFFMNRINMDSTMAILNIYIFSFWLNNYVFLFIFFSVNKKFFFLSNKNSFLISINSFFSSFFFQVFTIFLRINFLPIFSIMILHILFSWEERNVSFKG